MTIAVVATNNLFGHYADLLIRHNYGGEVKSTFPRRFDIADMDSYVGEDTNQIIIVGHSFGSNQFGFFLEKLQEINFDIEMPFLEITHIANYGAELDIKDINSTVDGERSITTILGELLETGTDLNEPVELDTGSKKLIQYLEEYHQYTFLHHPTSAPLTLKLLSDVYQGNVYKEVSLDPEGIHYNKVLRDSLYANMEDYILDKLDKVEVRLVNGVVVCLTYAEDYHNELASRIMKGYQDAGYGKVIVMIGKQTRGDDMFHIRITTDTGLNAEEIARKINDGKGNEHAATVFLAKPRQALMNTVENQLSTYL